MTTKTAARSRYVTTSLNARCVVWNRCVELVNRLSVQKLQFAEYVDSRKACGQYR
jgi:hypothetical protein